MTQVSKLQYGERFGNDVLRVAREQVSLAASASDAEVATARYAKWFHGEDFKPEPFATSSKRFRRITADMAAAEVAAATKENLAILGDDASALFGSKLPRGHSLQRAIRSSVLPDVPYLGVCKFGEIITNRSRDKVAVTQVFIANFDGDLDTSGGQMYKPRRRDFDQMFFGMHLLFDINGNPLGFNRELGRDGVAFKTKDMVEALYSIASASTGLSQEALQMRAAAARKNRGSGISA